MPDYKVAPGHRVSAKNVIYPAGATVTLSKEAGDELTAAGALASSERGHAAAVEDAAPASPAAKAPRREGS